jgi:Nitroreductase family
MNQECRSKDKGCICWLRFATQQCTLYRYVAFTCRNLRLRYRSLYERTTAKYSARGMRHVHMEVGHAAQDVYLQAVALDLRTVAIGAFDAGVKRVAHRSKHEQPLYLLLPVEGNNHRGALDKASNRHSDSTEGKHGKCTAGKFHRLARQQKAEKN